MKALVSTLLLLCLVACATVQDLRRGSPKLTLTTTKLIGDVAPCIVEAWLGLSTALANYDVRTLPLPSGGTTVLLGSPSSSLPIAFVDLERVEATGRTKASYYAQSIPSIGGFFEAQEKIVKQCI
jgi:hypothetical protein